MNGYPIPMTNIDTARTEVLAELHAMLDCFPIGSHRRIIKAARYIEDGKMDDVLANPGAASISDLSDLAICLA